jgi:homoserine O-acetyltransferase/O-succinyltransferase
MRRISTLVVPLFIIVAGSALASEPKESDYVARDFKFASGETLAELKLHYTTIGTLQRDAAGHATNAVLMLHGTTGTGKNFLAPSLANVLFGPGQVLDTTKYFIILPDGIGRGGSSKPSDGLRTKFPHYGYNDIVTAQHALVTDGLAIDHLRLIVGTSMGGMHSWLWAERYPDMADGIMPVASQPVAVTGRNYLWRLMITQAIRSDPDWQDGNYQTPPSHFVNSLPLFNIMTGSPRTLEAAGRTQADARATLEKIVADARKAFDANDYLYWFTAVDDYNPEPDLDKIRAKVFAVNFADDLLNPVQLNTMERVMPKVPGGRYVIVPEGPETMGHQTLTQGKVWAPYLVQLIASLSKGE